MSDAFKSCLIKHPDKELNPHTCRFVAKCAEGKERDPVTFRCFAKKAGNKTVKNTVTNTPRNHMFLNLPPYERKSVPLNRSTTKSPQLRTGSRNHPKLSMFNRFFNMEPIRENQTNKINTVPKNPPKTAKKPVAKPLTNAQKAARKQAKMNREAHVEKEMQEWNERQQMTAENKYKKTPPVNRNTYRRTINEEYRKRRKANGNKRRRTQRLGTQQPLGTTF